MKHVFLLLTVFFTVMFVASCHDNMVDDPEPQNQDKLSKVLTIKYDGNVVVTSSLSEAIDIVTSPEYLQHAQKMKKGIYASVDCSIISCQATSGYCLVECCYSSGGVSYHIMEI